MVRADRGICFLYREVAVQLGRSRDILWPNDLAVCCMKDTSDAAVATQRADDEVELTAEDLRSLSVGSTLSSVQRKFSCPCGTFADRAAFVVSGTWD